MSYVFLGSNNHIMFMSGFFWSVHVENRLVVCSGLTWVMGSTVPMYVSGRRRMCSSWVFFWYTRSTDSLEPALSFLAPSILPLSPLPFAASCCDRLLYFVTRWSVQMSKKRPFYQCAVGTSLSCIVLSFAFDSNKQKLNTTCRKTKQQFNS